jgi:hypothetical protein
MLYSYNVKNKRYKVKGKGYIVSINYKLYYLKL